jgi:hypothetical protein
MTAYEPGRDYIAEGRDWLVAYLDGDMPFRISDEDVRVQVDRRYPGGWPKFLRDPATADGFEGCEGSYGDPPPPR